MAALDPLARTLIQSLKDPSHPQDRSRSTLSDLQATNPENSGVIDTLVLDCMDGMFFP